MKNKRTSQNQVHKVIKLIVNQIKVIVMITMLRLKLTMRVVKDH
jgi:hypothetical protein